MTFQVAELSELFIACIKLAGEGLCRSVDNFVCSYISALCKCFAADVAAVGPLASVTPFMCFEISHL